jgi:hypothetical protein
MFVSSPEGHFTASGGLLRSLLSAWPIPSAGVHLWVGLASNLTVDWHRHA